MKSFFSSSRSGFTLVELLLCVAVVAILATLIALGGAKVFSMARAATCAHGLRQLATAIHFYADDHGDRFPPYVAPDSNGRTWFFGFESSNNSGEGDRDLQREKGPLWPYTSGERLIELCPSFHYKNTLYKPKFRGASWGYGYNWILGGSYYGPRAVMRRSQIVDHATTVLFADCAQVNTFQSPATPDNPMIEEFYLIDPKEYTIHFRHAGKAQAVFIDGHVEKLEPHGALDPRMENETIGRINPRYFSKNPYF